MVCCIVIVDLKHLRHWLAVRTPNQILLQLFVSYFVRVVWVYCSLERGRVPNALHLRMHLLHLCFWFSFNIKIYKNKNTNIFSVFVSAFFLVLNANIKWFWVLFFIMSQETTKQKNNKFNGTEENMNNFNLKKDKV